MRRRKFIALLGGTLAAWPVGAAAEQTGKVYRIGMLEVSSAVLNAANLDAFRQGLRELGYVEGQNLIIEYRSSDGRAERFAQLATELIRLKVDLIVARGTPAVEAASRASATIPIVIAAIAAPPPRPPHPTHPAPTIPPFIS